MGKWPPDLLGLAVYPSIPGWVMPVMLLKFQRRLPVSSVRTLEWNPCNNIWLFFSASCLQFAHAPILLIDCFLAWLNSHFFSLKRSNCLAYTCSASLVTSSYLCFSFSLKPSWFSRFILVKWDGSKLLHPKYPQIKTENKQCRQSIVGQLASYPTRAIPDMLRMLAIPLLYVAIVGWSQ